MEVFPSESKRIPRNVKFNLIGDQNWSCAQLSFYNDQLNEKKKKKK